MIRLPETSLSSQPLGKYWQQNNQKTEHTETQDTQKSGSNKQHKRTQTKKPMLRETDRTRFSFIYDIQPGNRAGLFLQPRSPHRVHCIRMSTEFLLRWKISATNSAAATTTTTSGFWLTVLFSINYFSLDWVRHMKNPLKVAGARLHYRPDALPVTQPILGEDNLVRYHSTAIQAISLKADFRLQTLNILWTLLLTIKIIIMSG